MNHLVDGRHSIRFRLTAWYAGILTLSFALAGAYVLFAVQDAAKETVDKDLRARLASVRSYLAKHTGGDAQSELAEIKTLVVDDKWLAALDAAIHGELDRISQALAHRVRELADRYETAMPLLAAKADDLEQTVNRHLEKMGFSWN